MFKSKIINNLFNNKSKNIILIFLPCAISFYRHINKFSIINSIFPLLLVEVAPFIALALIDNGDIFISIFSYFLLCVFYEIGYVINDSVKTKVEEIKTIRNSIDPEYLTAFILYRIFLVIGILLYVFYHFEKYFLHYLIFSICLTLIFYLHNKFENIKYQIFTFMLLNILKTIFRTFNVGSVLMFLIAYLPYFFIKFLHYLNHKKAISFSKINFNEIVDPIYYAFFIIIAFIDLQYIPITILFFINHKKREWINFFK